MANDSSYWYKLLNSKDVSSELPVQAIPSAKKNDKWKRQVMDALERIGVNQYWENIKYEDFYRMTRGDVSVMELTEIIPQLREVSSFLNDLDLPTTIKHYDILGPVLNKLETVIMENKDKFNPILVDDISFSEREEEQSRLLQSYIKEVWDKEIQLRLAEEGYDLNKTKFASEEEKQAYIQQIQQRSEQLTPPRIKEYMETEWTPAALQFAKAVINGDTHLKRLNELNRELIRDYLRTGRMFKAYDVKYDSYSIERWPVVGTFISKEVGIKYPQYGEYIGNTTFMTASAFVNSKGSHLTMLQKKKILSDGVESSGDSEKFSFDSALKNNFQQTHLVPFENYYDYNMLLDLENLTGIPLGETVIVGKDGKQEKVSDYLPRKQGSFGRFSEMARHINSSRSIRTDLIMCTKAFWRSWKLVGFLTYVDKNGSINIQIVTDDLLKDFLEDYGIKQIRNISMEEFLEKREPNTIVWDYIPEIWQGEKATTSSTPLEEDLYFNIGPLPYQIKGDSSIFDLLLPVAGIVDDNPSLKITKYQSIHNIAMNQMVKLMEQELGIFFLFDPNFIPSDIKDYGDTEAAMLHMVNIIRGTGLFGVDGSTKNIQGSIFNNFQRVDMSLGEMIRQKADQAEYAKMKAWEVYGMTPQSLVGEVVNYQTAEGVKQNNSATYSQTDYLFDAFSGFESRALEMHLAIAQYCHSDKKEIVLPTFQDELTRAFVKVSDPTIPLRWYRIMPSNDSKKRKEMEIVKQFMINNNTMDSDVLEFAKIVSSDSMSNLIQIAKLERKRKEMYEELQHRRLLELEDKKASAEKDMALFKWKLEETTNEKDRLKDIEVKRLDASGRAADNDASFAALDYINNQADRALLKQKTDEELKISLRSIEAEIATRKDELRLQEEELKLKNKELALKEKQMISENYRATINKN